MKIRRFDLQAFGPFSDRVLDMQAAPGSLQILKGRNGAGKSSSLRALSALLFGFPHNTPDAWLHENRKLRLGALLEDGDGNTLEIVRSKGRKDTLRDPEGKVLAEAELGQLLGGMHQELYGTLFALDHQRLREAGKQLVHGGEDLGESLFGAGMGRDVHQLLARLRDNADKLFLPRGKTPALNAAISAFKRAHSTATKAQLQPASWAAAKRDEAKLLQEREHLDKELKTLQAQRERLQRLGQVLPLLASFDELQRQRNALGDPVLLPAEASKERLEVMDSLRMGEAALAQLDKRIAELTTGQGDDDARNDLLIHGDQIKALFKRLGAQQNAGADRVGLRARIQAAGEDTRSALAGEDTDDHIGPGRQPRLRKLISQHQLLIDQQAGSAAARQLASVRLQRLNEQLDALGEIQDATSLLAAVESTKAAGDLTRQRIETANRVSRCRTNVAELLARMGLWTGPLEDLQRLPFPSEETVARFEVRWSQLDHDEAELDASEQNLTLNQNRVRDQREALEKQGQLPSEEALQAARARRDKGWQLVQRAWLDELDITEELTAHMTEQQRATPSHRELADDVGESLRAADHEADLLRRSTEQATLLAQLDEQQHELNVLAARHTEQRAALSKARETLGADWAKPWSAAGIDPLPPGEMRVWLERLAGLRDAVDDLGRAKDADQVLRDRMAQHVQQLRRALSDLGVAWPATERPVHETQGVAPLPSTGAADHNAQLEADAANLTPLYEFATKTLVNIQSLAAKANQLDQRRDQLADTLAQAQLTEREDTTKLTVWQEHWSAAMTGLPLREGVTTEEVEAFLDARVALAKQVQGLRDLQARVAGIDQAQQLFEEDMAQLVESCAPQLRDLDPEAAAEELTKRLAAAESAQALRERDNERLASYRKERDECETRLAADRVQRDQLFARARCQNLEELIAAEEQSDQARRLDDRLAESRQEVVAVGGAPDLPSLRKDVAPLDPDTLPGEMDRLAQEIDELSRRHSEAAQAYGAQTEVLKSLDQGAVAAEAAELAENELATVRDLTLAFARQHLAAHLLEREIQRYRQANQGPLLERAGQLFRRLTTEHFSDLTVAYDDDAHPSLICQRADEREVEPHQLSEGEADQLYLALRIASLERHLQRNTPLPFVADDLFISFDDDRAQAGLQVLGDLAQKTQVIFFTHHTRLAEIAQQTLGPDRIELFEL